MKLAASDARLRLGSAAGGSGLRLLKRLRGPHLPQFLSRRAGVERAEGCGRARLRPNLRRAEEGRDRRAWERLVPEHNVASEIATKAPVPPSQTSWTVAELSETETNTAPGSAKSSLQSWRLSVPSIQKASGSTGAQSLRGRAARSEEQTKGGDDAEPHRDSTSGLNNRSHCHVESNDDEAGTPVFLRAWLY